MKSEKEGKKEKNKEIKKPRYIENLLKSANKRKIENERRIERQIQKERELEGDEFADKEVFVTSAYKKKLEEMSLEEEIEKREEYLESIGDVTKQRDLGGFYRHLYEQKLGLEKDSESEEKQTSKESQTSNNVKNNSDLSVEHSKDNNKEASKKRNYRKRKSSSDSKKQLSEGEVEDSDEEINRINLDDIKMAKKVKLDNIDADSDFSIDDSSDEDDQNSNKGDGKNITEDVFKKPENIEKIENKAKIDANDIDKKPKDVAQKPKVNIWQKRTVGEVFEQALRRYYERKAARSLM
ncbi:hypothetical protein ABMA28_007059 [Loxostege sticticalis]